MMFTRTGSRAFGLSLLLGLSAQAQTVDYGSLTSLFNEPVTTSATGKPQKASDAPVGLDIITADQIRRMGVTSLPEVLGRLPGVTSWQATRSWSDIGIRGQNSPYNPTLLVLVNGRQVYIDSFGFTDWSLIPVQMEEIRQIEVVKGPATALYGFNAVSGVINIITYNPKYDKVNEVGAVGGSGDYGRAYGYKTLHLSDSADVRISGSADRFDEFDKHSKTSFPGPLSSFQDADERKLAADGLVQLNDHTQLRLETSYGHTQGTDATPQYFASSTDKRLFSAKADVISETPIGQVNASIYTNDYHNNLTEASSQGTLENSITVLQLQDLFKLSADHTFRLQTEYRHNSLESSEYIGPGAEVFYDSAAIGGMWNWAITPTVEWTNALRLEYMDLDRDGAFQTVWPFTNNDAFDRDLVSYGVNSGLAWKVTPRDTLRASFGRGVQAPSLIALGVDGQSGPNTIIAGNPDINPSIVYNYEIGYDRHLEQIDGKFRSALFYRTTSDITSIVGSVTQMGGTTLLRTGNVGDSRTVGTELGLSGAINPQWNWDVSYVYQQSWDDLSAAQAANTPIHYEDTVPNHTVKAHLGYTNGPWAADMYGEAASDFDTIYNTGSSFRMIGVDGYGTLGARVGYTFDNAITLAVMGSDLPQARLANNYGLENERRVFVSVSKKF